MDRENFNAIITRYLEKFDYTNGQGPQEYFKWQAVDCFQKNWDIEAENLWESFSRAVKETSVLLDGGHAAPSSGIKALLKLPEEVEFVREAFRRLFAEQEDLNKRDLLVDEFVTSVNERIKTHWPNDSYKPQTTRSALCYLTLAHPEQNYFYMFSKAENWAEYTDFGFDIGSGSSFSLPIYYRMCDELVEEIKADPRLQQCNRARLEKAGITLEDNYHTLAYDILYCATTYHLYIDIPRWTPKGVKNRIKRAEEREELNALLQEKLGKEKEFAAFEATSVLPPDLIGQTVTHKKYGQGSVAAFENNTLTVRFEQKESKFIYPDAFIGKFLTLASQDDMERITLIEESKKQRAKLEAAVKLASEEYEKKEAAFNKKWTKKIQNEDILEEDD